ncbi:glycosyltransferase family 9 protein [Sulfurirhabdus autotrophica]|uniref:ADP-heptose:LPS heptosyltransferase n=1 Tax=Sulfurirhabdus autotrophica TaxID=1706046 RepID=A0A4R3XYV8_9PROT|nr:glycosyltransferase family 9 protein [Sulfurirhabdus autotrophica]TCV84287.1 ADP-heptose:LPS heptosyltransferase [Sulfurirhabdus autotrophica]
MKILILKRDKIGDLLLTTPMLSHLRQSLPNAEIHLLANNYNAWVVAENTDIDQLWIYRRAKSGRKIDFGAVIHQIWQQLQLRFQRFDVAIVAGGEFSPRAVKRALSIHAKRTITYCDESAVCARVSDPLPAPAGEHESDRMLNLLLPLQIRLHEQVINPTFNLPAQWQLFAENWLFGRHISPRKYIVIGLGARRAKKQPTSEQVFHWAAYFKEHFQLDTLFMWTPGKSDNPLYPGDDEVAQPVLDAAVPYIYPFRGALMPALGLIWNARTSIFPDSGLMHFAAASPGGVLGLFAETDVSPSPVQWGPRGAKVAFLEATKSVAEIGDQMIYDKLESLLA